MVHIKIEIRDLTMAYGSFVVMRNTLGLLLFSSSKLFTATQDFIMYFDESLNGLNEGAPVKYRGVRVGSVKRVMVRYNQATNDYALPVIVQLEEKLINERLGEPGEVFRTGILEERIRHGFRASLQAESLVTGVLYIEVRPHADAALPVYHQLHKRYIEIPTEPAQIQQLFNNLASLDVKGIETNINALLLKLDSVVGGLRMSDINEGNVIVSVQRLVNSPAITNDLALVGTAMEQYRLLGEKLNHRIDPLADSFTNSLVEAERSLAQIRGAAENLRTLIAPDSPLRNNLDQALQQLAGAGQSLATLADFLKQHPNALISGRQTTEKNR
jgi:Paraquat-inducible protein B